MGQRSFWRRRRAAAAARVEAGLRPVVAAAMGLEQLEQRQLLSLTLDGSYIVWDKRSAIPVAADDLIDNSSPYRWSVQTDYQQSYEGSTDINVLTDGTAGIPIDATPADDIPADYNNKSVVVFDRDHQWQATYALDTATNPNGYTITRVHVTTGTHDDRVNMAFDILVRKVGSTEFVSITGGQGVVYAPHYRRPGDPTIKPGDTVADASAQAQLSSTTGALATGVAEVRFVSLAADPFDPYPNGPLYRELDIIGKPTATADKPVVTATPGSEQVKLTWPAVEQAESYTVKRYLVDGSTEVLATDVTEPSFFVTGLANGETVRFVVAANNSLGAGPDSDPVEVTPTAVPPAAATNVMAQKSANGVALSWTASDFATSYKVYRSSQPDAGFELVAEVTDTTLLDTSAPTGTLQYYKVVASNSGGDAADSAVVSQVAGVIGTGLTAHYFDNRDYTGTRVDRVEGPIDFNWPTDVDGGSPAPGIGGDDFIVIWEGRIEALYTEDYAFGIDSDDGARLFIDGVEVVGDWRDRGRNNWVWSLPTVSMVAGQQYNIRLEMYEAGGGAGAALMWWSPSTGAQIVPVTQLYPTSAAAGLEAATDLVAVPTAEAAGRVKLTWTDNATQNTGYRILRSTSPTGPFELVGEAWGAATNTAYDRTAGSETLYYYQVIPFNNGGTGPESNVAEATTGLWGTGNGLMGRYFDNDNFTGTRISRIDPTVNFDWGNNSPDPAIGPDTFSVIWEGWVEAQFTEVYTFLTDTDDGVRLFINGQKVIEKWEGQGMGEKETSATLVPEGIPLVAGQRYSIRFEYYEGTGGAGARLYWSSPSTPEQIIPQSQLYYIGPSSLPATPTDLVAEPGVDQPFSTLVTWTDASDNETGFRIYRATSPEGPFTLAGAVLEGVTSFRDHYLAGGQTYYYRVTAENDLGESEFSNIDDATTSGATSFAGPGVSAHYWATKQEETFVLDGLPLVARQEAMLAMEAGEGSPVPGLIGVDNFTVQWTGKLTAPATGWYTLIVRTDDGARLWFDGRKVVDVWRDKGTSDEVASVYMEAGKAYNFVFDMYEQGGGATALFEWVRPDGTREKVPTTALSAASDVPAAPVLTLGSAGTDTVVLTWEDRSRSETKFVVERSTSADFSTDVVRRAVGINEVLYTDTGLTPGTTYYYRVTAENWDGAATSQVLTVATPTQAPAGGYVTLNASNSRYQTVNLSDRGTTDWVMFGHESPYTLVRNGGVTPVIGPVQSIGGGVWTRFEAYDASQLDRVSFDWTNGTLVTSATNVRRGVYVTAVNDGFRFTVPADTNSRTFTLFGQAYKAQATVRAWLSDGSQPVQTTTIVSTDDGDASTDDVATYEFTINYSAASAGQYLIVEFVMDANYGSGNVAVHSALLSGGDLETPRNLAAQQVGSDVRLTWSNPSYAGSAVVIESSEDGINWTVATTAPVDATSVVLTGVEPGAKFYRAKVAAGYPGQADSYYSNVVRFGVIPVQSSFEYDGFADATGLQINGHAKVVDGVIRVTDANDQRSSVFINTAQPIGRFNASFDFRMTDINGSSANADGMAFVIQANAPTALGNGGGSLGYGGMQKSIAVKFDIYNNIDETGFYLNGAGPSDTPGINLRPFGIDLDDGTLWRASVAYDGTYLSVAITDPSNPARSARFAYQVDLPAILGDSYAYFGFTGATGGSNIQSDVSRFSYSSATGATLSDLATEGDDRFYVKIDGTTASVWLNPTLDAEGNPTGAAARTLEVSSLSDIVLDAKGGNDTLTVDYGAASPTLSLLGGIQYTGGSGDDALIVRGGAGDDVLSFASDALSGQLLAGTPSVPVIVRDPMSGDMIESVRFDGGGQSTTGVTGGDVLRVYGSEYSDYFNVAGDTIEVPSTFGVTYLKHEGIERIGIYGGAGDDAMTVNSTPTAAVTLFGQDGNNSVSVYNAGTVWTTALDATSAGNLTVTLDAGTTTVIAADLTVNSMTLAGDAKVRVDDGIGAGQAGVGATLRVTQAGAFYMDPAQGAAIDIGLGDGLILAGGASALAQVQEWLAAGRGTGTWDQPGIHSTELRPANNPAGLKAAALVHNDDGAGAALLTSVDGQAVGTDHVLLRVTLKGDADLNGTVDAADYYRVDRGFALGLTGWTNGDFDNGTTAPNADDYLAMDKAFMALRGWAPAGGTGLDAGAPEAPAAVAAPAAAAAPADEPATAPAAAAPASASSFYSPNEEDDDREGIEVSSAAADLLA